MYDLTLWGCVVVFARRPSLTREHLLLIRFCMDLDGNLCVPIVGPCLQCSVVEISILNENMDQVMFVLAVQCLSHLFSKLGIENVSINLLTEFYKCCMMGIFDCDNVIYIFCRHLFRLFVIDNNF